MPAPFGAADASAPYFARPGGEHAVVVCDCDDASATYRDPNAGGTVTIDNDTSEK